MKPIFTLLIAGLMPLTGFGEAYQPIKASYQLAGKLAYGDIEPGQSHLYLKIMGQDAVSLFNALPHKSESCSAGETRHSGNIICHKQVPITTSYCIFAIDIAQNKVAIGETC